MKYTRYRNTIMFFKTTFLGLALIFISFALNILYIKSASGNIVFRDQLFIINSGLLDKFFSNAISFEDLWRAAGAIRLLGYHILFLLNAKYFHLNTQVEMYLSSLVLFVISLSLYRYYVKILSGFYSHVFIQMSFMFTTLIIFSLNQWESLVFGFGFIFVSPMLAFLITFLLVEGMLSERKMAYIGTIFAIMMLVSILVFGGAYSLGFVASLFAVILFHFLTTSRQLKQSFLRSLILLVGTSTIGLLLYSYNILENNYFPYQNQRLSAGFELLSAHPMSVVKFLLLALASSSISVDFLNHFLNLGLVLAIGCLLVCIYIYSLRLYMSSGLYSQTYLPLFFITYSWSVLLCILFARFDYGVNYGMASRYTSNTQYGIIGIVWIVIYNFQHPSKQSWLRKGLLIGILLFIFVGQFLTYWTQYKIAPYRKQNFNKLRTIAMNPKKYSSSDLSLFEANNVSEIIDGLEILRNYNLNIYHDFTSQEIPQLLLKHFGPTDIRAGQPFNMQAGGESAIWANTENATVMELKDPSPTPPGNGGPGEKPRPTLRRRPAPD